MVFALVKNGYVSKIESDLTDDQIVDLFKEYENIIDITNFSLQPSIGWKFNGIDFDIPPESSDYNSLVITRLAFMNRLTDMENVLILVYIDNPAATYRYPVKMLMNKLNAAQYIDLQRSDTQAGVQLLVLAGLLTSTRANTILTTKPALHEIYKGTK